LKGGKGRSCKEQAIRRKILVSRALKKSSGHRMGGLEDFSGRRSYKGKKIRGKGERGSRVRWLQ